eukprot:4307769-Ditylum_brightwellii.AAC.1
MARSKIAAMVIANQDGEAKPVEKNREHATRSLSYIIFVVRYCADAVGASSHAGVRDCRRQGNNALTKGEAKH